MSDLVFTISGDAIPVMIKNKIVRPPKINKGFLREVSFLSIRFGFIKLRAVAKKKIVVIKASSPPIIYISLGSKLCRIVLSIYKF